MMLAITIFPYDNLTNGNEKLGELNKFKEELANKEKEIQDKLNAQKLEQAKNEETETAAVTPNETITPSETLTTKPQEENLASNVVDDPKLMEVLDSINRINDMIGNESIINTDDYIKYRNLKFCLIGEIL